MKKGMTKSVLIAAFLAAPFVMPLSAEAQEGQTRVQGRVLDEPAVTAAPSAAQFLDIRQEMRGFIQNISRFAKQRKKNFYVIPSNGHELSMKADPEDETKSHPARTYIRSIDGLFIDGLYLSPTGSGNPRSKEILNQEVNLIKRAQKSGLPVFAIDYARNLKSAKSTIKSALKDDIVPFVANTPPEELDKIPPFPSRPLHENGNSILSLVDVKNFVVIRNSASFGRQDEFAMKIHDTNFDLVIIDTFHGRKALSKQAVETLKYKKLGARRLVFALMDIGSAASYRYYWKDDWQEGSPDWIGAPFKNDPDRHYVNYWDPGWQEIIWGNAQSYLYGIIAQGYDGVILEGVKNYRIIEDPDATQEE